jgi:hypothetical protein
MKKVLITIFCISLSAVAVKAQQKTTDGTKPPVATTATPAAKQADPDAGEFKFKDKDDTHDYGEVPEGPDAEYDFKFKNTGKKPINITNARGSCGCTVPTWPHEPILPGKEGVIHVTYHSNGRPGPISKEVTIESDAKQQPMVLHIRGTVKPKPVENKPATPNK